MVLSWQQTLKEIDAGMPPHVILLHGEDQYMRSVVISQLTRRLERYGEVHVARQDPPFKEKEVKDNQEPASEKTELNPDITAALSSGSLFSSIELVILPSTFYAKAALFLAKAPDTATVIFQSSRKIPPTHKVFKASGWTVECSPLKRGELTAWMSGAALRLGNKISADAAAYLSFISGNNMGVIVNELEKFSLYLSDNGPITLDLVKRLGSRTAGMTIFNLSDAVSTRNSAALRASITDLLEQDQAPYRLLAAISMHLLDLLETVLRKRDGSARNPGDIARALEISYYPRKNSGIRLPTGHPTELKRPSGSYSLPIAI